MIVVALCVVVVVVRVFALCVVVVVVVWVFALCVVVVVVCVFARCVVVVFVFLTNLARALHPWGPVAKRDGGGDFPPRREAGSAWDVHS